MRAVRRLSTLIAPIAIALIAGALVAGCSGAATDTAPPVASVSSTAVAGATVSSAAVPGTAASATAPTASAPTVTITSTAAGATVTAAPPPATAEPAAVDGDCPYLATDAVAEINGQRTGTTQIIAVEPQPICMFYRSDGGWLASVRIIQADTPQAAVAAVDQHVPIDNSNPANQPPGWTGGSMATDAGSVYAVSKGNIAVVAESNQPQSIKGRQMVIQSVTNLGL